MDKKKSHPLETKQKAETKKYRYPPVSEEETLRIDVKRKDEEVKNNTIGGF